MQLLFKHASLLTRFAKKWYNDNTVNINSQPVASIHFHVLFFYIFFNISKILMILKVIFGI